MYRSKQMQWGNVNANGMSDAVSQAAQATALLQEANKGLSGIGDSISKVGDSVTKYGTDMETRYNKEKTEIIEGIAHDIYNSAIADSTDANGKVNFDTFDKVVTMGMTSLGQGDYAMDKKDINSVLKHVNSLMNRSDATQNNVSIGDLALRNEQHDHVVKVYDETQLKNQFNTVRNALKDQAASEVVLLESLPENERLIVAKELTILDDRIFKELSKDNPVIKSINNERKKNKKNPMTYRELVDMLSSTKIENKAQRQLMGLLYDVIQRKGVVLSTKYAAAINNDLGGNDGQQP